MSFVDQLLYVPGVDPEDARRRRLLGILLVGIAALMLLLILATVVASFAGLVQREYVSLLLRGSLVGVIGVTVVYLINRYWSGWVASSVFLLLLICIPAISDDPEQVVDGRTLFVFVIPILMASVLLRPYASFVVAALVSVLLVVVGVVEQIVPNLIAMIGFFAVALVSWISARSLEHTLAEQRRMNLELDRRVDERTKDLVEALAREHAEANKNQAILEGIADGVIVFDRAGRAIVANPAIGRILSRPISMILGRDIAALMGKDVPVDDQKTVTTLLREGDPRRSSVRFEWGERTLSVSFAPVRSAPGQVAGTVAAFHDLTLDAEIDRMKSDFVSTVSHELRTPLTSVKGYLDLVLMGAAGPTNKQQESFLKIAKSNADRLHVLVSDLLDLSRIEAGKVELDIQIVSLPELIDQVTSSLRKEFEDRGLSLTVEVPPDLPEIFADPARITQVLMNLLSNAYKYTSEGGVILRAKLGTGFLQVDVIDTGLGIAEDDQAKLFTPFFRAEDNVVRQQTGTGLGLSITKSLIQMHGGQIWAESEVGTGSSFSFTLPLPAGIVDEMSVMRPEPYTPAGWSSATAEPTIGTGPAGSSILVADDEEDVAHLFRHQLERAGYGVTVVTQGSQVVQVARQSAPDLITLDLLMDVDGLTVLSELKADPLTADIPVVIISVISDSSKGLAMGAIDYLVKPIDEKELLDCVQQVLDPVTDGERNNILVVDDERDIVSWLKHSLTLSGYRVTAAYDGIEALEVVAADPPDLILLDMKMPRMDGRAMLRRLRKQEESRHIPVIVLSADAVAGDVERARLADMGVREFLHKPVTMDQLVMEIEKHL